MYMHVCGIWDMGESKAACMRMCAYISSTSRASVLVCRAT